MLKCPHCSAILACDLVVAEVPQNSLAVRRSARGRFGLTQSEGKVVDMVVDGLENREIAKELSVGVQVIKNYLCKAFGKIGCSNRTEMVSMVLLGTDKPR